MTKFNVGDAVGIGFFSETCMECRCRQRCNSAAPIDIAMHMHRSCASGNDLGCEKGITMTSNDRIKHGTVATHTGVTYGGYSNKTAIQENYAMKVS